MQKGVAPIGIRLNQVGSDCQEAAVDATLYIEVLVINQGIEALLLEAILDECEDAFYGVEIGRVADR